MNTCLFLISLISSASNSRNTESNLNASVFVFFQSLLDINEQSEQSFFFSVCRTWKEWEMSWVYLMTG